MTIASEITRLQNDKAAICTAIENKGVTVGNVTFDDYAACIDAIQSGSMVGYVDMLVIGGGGGGGKGSYSGCCSMVGGGGGGGGVKEFKCKLIGSELNITIGAGGIGGCGTTSAGAAGGNGGNTTVVNGLECIVVRGGGGGGSGGVCSSKGLNGANGGGGAGYCAGNCGGGRPSNAYDGNPGHTGCCTQNGNGGGGGAYSNTKYNACTTFQGANGYNSSIFGGYFAGGGGGAGNNNTCSGAGGCGGGGTGGNFRSNRAATSATCFGGGGGGGRGHCSCGSSSKFNGGDGCSGAVLIRYPTDGSYCFTCATGGTVTTSGGYNIHTFSSNGTFCIIS